MAAPLRPPTLKKFLMTPKKYKFKDKFNTTHIHIAKYYKSIA